jgi:6-pyruvoyltetrahydropterin/6-carboxytetrahydropterin synthase
MQNEVTISKKFEFSSSHRYWNENWTAEKNEQVFGLCTSPYGHGHNYELHVTVKGKIDNDTGMIVNLTDLKHEVNQVLKEFDHRYLNLDTPYFKTKIPTTENISLVLFDLIETRLSKTEAFQLHRIRLYERGDIYADVWREED